MLRKSTGLQTTGAVLMRSGCCRSFADWISRISGVVEARYCAVSLLRICGLCQTLVLSLSSIGYRRRLGKALHQQYSTPAVLSGESKEYWLLMLKRPTGTAKRKALFRWISLTPALPGTRKIIVFWETTVIQRIISTTICSMHIVVSSLLLGRLV